MPNIKIFSKDYCPYCHKIKSFFRDKGFEFQSIDLTGKESEFEELSKKTGMKTVPQVFINDVFIGGCDDTLNAYKEGKLKELLS